METTPLHFSGPCPLVCCTKVRGPWDHLPQGETSRLRTVSSVLTTSSIPEWGHTFPWRPSAKVSPPTCLWSGWLWLQ